MSVSYTYPGIYIQEQQSSSNAIIPAPTSIAAFVGYSHPFQTEEFNFAQQLFSFNDYQTYFGPLFSSGLVDASLPRAVYQFFLNGGSVAWVVGLQPGLFDANGDIITRLGAANGGATITGSTSGGSSAEVPFVISGNSALPTISSVSPTSTTVGDVPFTLTVNGANFISGSKVYWNGKQVTNTPAVTSPYELTVQIEAADMPGSPYGPVSVTVVNPSPSGTSNAVTFTVNGTDLAPVITSISPNEVPAGGASFPLTINGANFVPTSVVNFGSGAGSAGATTYVSDTVLQVTVTPAASPGTSTVTVTNPSIPHNPSNPITFTAGSATPTPVIASISPASITAGAGSFTLTINGSNFASTPSVNWSNSSNPSAVTTLTSVNLPSAPSQTLTVSVPAGLVTAGTATITVANPGPPPVSSNAIALTINGSNLEPTISSISPTGVLVNSSQPVTLTITGSNFVPGSTVYWSLASSPTPSPLTPKYFSDTELEATIPTADITSAGVAYITVSNAMGAGIVFTALELTDAIPMTVTITNVRNNGATFDVVITYGTRLETYRGVQLPPAPTSQLPEAVINGVSQLVTVAPAPGGYGTSIAPQQFSLAYDFPANLSTCFSAADYLTGDESSIGSFEPNSPLDTLEIFNLLLIPGVSDFSIVSAALAFAERKRAFLILDLPQQAPAFAGALPPPQPGQVEPQPVANWMEGLGGPTGPSMPVSQNGAGYFPYLISNDPVTGDNIPMAPSGFVAGIYAQTDASRGVWKAPAGLATVVLNTNGPILSGIMNDPQQGVLNIDSINCLRTFSGIGTVVWGARTLVAQNPAYQQWMYVSVRRMTLFIEQTLLANLRWVVFEPNDEPLWIAITASISAFLLSLFNQGALQGSTPSQAFQVKCDSTTTSPQDQETGIVNIVVAFAPLKPAEFVVIQIAQLAGQTAGS
jgi:uncharacterized protein